MDAIQRGGDDPRAVRSERETRIQASGRLAIRIRWWPVRRSSTATEELGAPTNALLRPSATRRPSGEIAGNPPSGKRRRMRPLRASHRIVSPWGAEVRSAPAGVNATCGSPWPRRIG